MAETHTELQKGCPIAPDGEPLTRTAAWFYKFTAPSRQRARDEKRILMMDVELTDKCFGGCVYCFASGRKDSNFFIPRERMFGLIDEAKEIGLRQVLLLGGEPLLHPDWYDFSRYTLDQGMRSVICSTGDYYTPKVAKTIVHDLKIQENGYCTVHIPTINQKVYEQLCPSQPQGLKNRIRGIYNLLEAGYPPEKVYCQLVLCKPILETLEETIDWLVDEIGVSFVVMYPYRLKGYARENTHLLPTLSEMRRAYEYRAKKMGSPNYLKMADTELTKFFCHNMIYIEAGGDVLPCDFLPDFAAGNIYQKSLVEIFHEKRDLLTHCFEVHGPCAECENNVVYDVCRGCRANAYIYLGDHQASDPCCWMNPQAKERYWE